MAENLVTLWRYRDLPEALIAQGKLQAEGLTCFLADDNIVRMDWFWSNLIGGVRLQVQEDHVEEALALLAEEIPAELLIDDIGEVYSQPQCPQCCSRDVTFSAGGKKMAVLALGILLVPALAPAALALPLWLKKPWSCEDCGHDWEAADN